MLGIIPTSILEHMALEAYKRVPFLHSKNKILSNILYTKVLEKNTSEFYTQNIFKSSTVS